MKSVLGVIPARAGSRRLPGKNIRILEGRPLIHYTIRAAQESRTLSDLIVSTDSWEIARKARNAGAKTPFLRPLELSGDGAGSWPVLRHAVEFWEKGYGKRVDAAVLLQPTSPLRTAEDIDRCVEKLFEDGADACLSVEEKHQSPNGAVYAIRRQALDGLMSIRRLEKVSFYQMPVCRSVDIDTEDDFALAEFWIKRMGKSRGHE